MGLLLQVDATDKVVSIIASDNYKAGVECAEDMMSKLDKGAKIAAESSILAKCFQIIQYKEGVLKAVFYL